MDEQEYAVTPEAVFEPQTEVFYAYGLDAAKALAADKLSETGKGWNVYARVER